MAKGKFCPKCGREAEKFHDGLCENCFREKISFAENLPKKVAVKTCKGCGKVYILDKGFEREEEAIENFLKRAMRENEIKSVSYRISGERMFVTIFSSTSGVEKTEETEIPIIFKNIVCKHCSLRERKYFNAILQIRVPKKLEKEIFEEVENRMAEIRKVDNYAFISSVEKLKKGIDVYIGSKSAAEKVIRHLKNKYRIVTKASHKLSGTIEGKKVYRDTISIKVENWQDEQKEK